jgi:hypothetical protein
MLHIYINIKNNNNNYESNLKLIHNKTVGISLYFF